MNKKAKAESERKEKYYIVKKAALPEVLLKVVEVNKILERSGNATIQDAVEKVGISRSSYYKYKDDIVPFHDNARGKTITFMLQMADEPGILSLVLNEVAKNGANVLTINQSIPINGSAPVTMSLEILPTTVDIMVMIEAIEAIEGIRSLKILARE
ncbi:MAG: ACT domain-containing protein [Lachnospiraceae bacterium]|nr:ACT domain-containing protein [Lachnospiraceae bacterium]